MFKFLVASALIVCCTAYGNYGSSGGSGRSSGGGRQLSSGGGYGSGGPVYGGQVVPAAIQTRHTVEYRDVPTTSNVNPTTVEVGANSIPLQILFRSSSSSLNVQQAHDGAQGSVQESSSEDEPHRLVHSVTKPIIQEVREIITPFRKITQEIQPVQEEILTIVARGNERDQGQGNQGSSDGSNLGNDLAASIAASLGGPAGSGVSGRGGTKSRSY